MSDIPQTSVVSVSTGEGSPELKTLGSLSSMFANSACRVAVIGTSLVQQNEAATTAKVSHWIRGWLSWARYFAKGRFYCEIWNDPTIYKGWEPSGTEGATRGFTGLNAGVSGQTIAQITARKCFVSDGITPDFVILDAGTNDMSTLSKESINQSRIALADYYLKSGIRVIFLPILSRGISSWAAGSPERAKAAWINQQTRAYCNQTDGAYLFDWNIPWVDSANANGEPRAGFSNDGIHFAPAGGIAVGESLAAFMAKIMPDPMPRVWSQDDKFDATNNPNGNLLANPFCTGTTGALGTGATGTVATGMRVEVSTGNATVACSKETRTDNRGDYQVLTFTPNTTESLAYFRTSSADTAHSYPAGTWVQASIEADIGSFNGWQGITLYLKDNGTNGLIAYDMEPFDDGAGNIKLPLRNIGSGMLVTPPIQIVSGSPTLRWRVEIRVASTGSGASGTGVVKLGAVELRQVESPITVTNYKGIQPC